MLCLYMYKSGADMCVEIEGSVCRRRTERDVGKFPRFNRYLQFASSLHLCCDVYAQPCERRQ